MYRAAAGLHPATLFKAVVAIVTDDDVIQDREPEQFTSGNQALGEFDIVSGRSRIARGMIVADDHAGRIRKQRRLEDLARLCCGRSYVV